MIVAGSLHRSLSDSVGVVALMSIVRGAADPPLRFPLILHLRYSSHHCYHKGAVKNRAHSTLKELC